MNAQTQQETGHVVAAETKMLTCGLIMPISNLDGCPAEHWGEVKQIVQDAVESVTVPKFTARLVSDADDVGVIQKRIVQGVYNSDVVVCDVSGKNPNVMFELGLRLAFDRPTVIIKDDKTDYSFDTGVIEHLTYPRDLRFAKIVAFKKQLADKIAATYAAAQNDGEHSTFLKSFGTFKVATLEQKEASGEQLVLEMLHDLQREVTTLRRSLRSTRDYGKDALTVDSAILAALVALRKADPSFALEMSDDLVGILLNKYKETTGPYDSKRAFEDAIKAACEVASQIHG